MDDMDDMDDRRISALIRLFYYRLLREEEEEAAFSACIIKFVGDVPVGMRLAL
ncbi:hypothetical protein J4760_08390 [Salinicoccus sp. ID82-1]|uniref:hypothetical protein n=1 Tax=Salinicoccus sp. ID82-1 TaxID=2820269 RepID=UPI001F379D33|nr:hypothetical protein [Salinicoccus sp. ID82-1]MCG1010037.1 hypothetical protein [Salinicoccus sp. ID82-1]